ncbi:MAG: NUDIX domain-containing protein [Ignavibacteriae bacterium]|nr:MAG: NUDIX domain-containing protein [Ignavibacteriota bacterium]
MYRIINGSLEVLLIHPGGPFFKNKDLGVWSLPKGEPDENDGDLLKTAIREFEEETGINPEIKDYIPLGTIIQRGGKTVHAWAFEGNIDDNYTLKSNTFKTEWPPNTGKWMLFPEVDRIGFFKTDEAKKKIKDRQAAFIDRLEEHLEQLRMTNDE